MMNARLGSSERSEVQCIEPCCLVSVGLEVFAFADYEQQIHALAR